MTITHWIPRSSLIDYQREIENLLDSFFGSRPEEETECAISPSVDIEELEKSYSINIELPGVNKKDVSINVNEDILSIEGEKKPGKDTNKYKYHRRERTYGKFHRSFRLPDIVDTNSIDAVFKNGVLNITIPKRKENLSKNIEIKID
ncbi:MAG: Hsp20/alpha crystallin family protein [Candidatus Marinimicrobia bacterium]|nr:Hsp20/alpha crystallin family protein [Candidatus Neomarinimicrobiota bacterium]